MSYSYKRLRTHTYSYVSDVTTGRNWIYTGSRHYFLQLHENLQAPQTKKL